MSLTIDSSRFGRLEIDPGTVIEFPEGLIGLGGARYALIARDAETPFLWLQCIDDPSLALPVTNPHRFFPGFAVQLTDEEAERLGLDDATGFDVYVTVRAGASLDDFTANLKAPILIRSGLRSPGDQSGGRVRPARAAVRGARGGRSAGYPDRMLRITRRAGERIMLGDDVIIEVTEVKGGTVRIGIEAPRSLRIYREELWLEVKRENEAAASAASTALADVKARLDRPDSPPASG